ncbi:hypothetical protein BTVI_30758 [Pitangus sulphuratus]|nr:hypothetical protein BTVI_30758 [Pitangus sulphuratus]
MQSHQRQQTHNLCLPRLQHILDQGQTDQHDPQAPSIPSSIVVVRYNSEAVRTDRNWLCNPLGCDDFVPKSSYKVEAGDEWCPSGSRDQCFSVSSSVTASEIECTLGKSADDTKLNGAVNTIEGQDAKQGHLEKLEKRSHGNLMQFNESKSRVLHLGWGSPRREYRLREAAEISSVEKYVGVLMGEKLDMDSVHWQPRRPTASWAASKATWPASRGR